MSMLKKIIVVGGVSGVGKTTISKMLADKMELPFYDADDFHPEANVQKMKSGHALDDADRKPWLITLAQNISRWECGKGAVLACSALKESYRELMQKGAQMQIIWIFLEGSPKLIADRLRNRKGHFFDPHLLKSQFDAYKRPTYGFYIDVAPPLEEIVANIREILTGKSSFGIIGLGDKGIQIACKLGGMQLKLSLYDPAEAPNGRGSAEQKVKKYPELAIASAFTDAEPFVRSLVKPYRMILMYDVKNSDPLLNILKPFLAEDDMLINIAADFVMKNPDFIGSITEKGVKLLQREDIRHWEEIYASDVNDSKLHEAFETITNIIEQNGDS